MKEIDSNGNVVSENVINIDTERKIENFNESLRHKNKEAIDIKNFTTTTLVGSKTSKSEFSRIGISAVSVEGKDYTITIYSYKSRAASYNAQVFSLILEDPTNEEKRLFYTVGNIIPKGTPAIHNYDIIASKTSIDLGSHFKAISSVIDKSNKGNDFDKIISPLAGEINTFSDLIKKFGNVNIVGNQIALIGDYSAIGCLEGLVDFGACLIATSSLIGICPLCAQVVTCIPACFDIFSLPLCLLCEGTGLGGCAACAIIAGSCVTSALAIEQNCL